MSHPQQEISLVVFDLDDTLYPERQFVRSGYAAVAERLRREWNRTERFEDWLWRRFLDGKTARAFDELNEIFRLGLKAADIARLVEEYRFHMPTLQPYESVPSLLETLGQTFRLGLLTDGPARMQLHKIKALGLLERFDAELVVLTDTLGPAAGKPSPMGFELLTVRANVAPVACAYVADNPVKDFVAPNALGWRTIRYRRDGQIYADCPVAPGGEPGFVVENDTQLLAALGVARSPTSSP